MKIIGFSHYNLRASREMLDRLRTFYTGVVGLTVGHRPPFKSFGYWLYAGEQAVLHLTEATRIEVRAVEASAHPGMPAPHSSHCPNALVGPQTPSVAEPLLSVTATFDHAAFNCRGRKEFEDMLTQLKIEYKVAHVPQTGNVQLFLTDPAGNGVELNFPAADG